MAYRIMIPQNLERKIAGSILAFISLSSIFVMLHHPSVSAENIYEHIKEVRQEAPINSFVHWVLIAFIMIINTCLTYYGKLRGFNLNSIFFGLTVYWVGSIVMVLAALLSGVVGPELASHYIQATAPQAEVFRGITLLKNEMNQAFANFSVFCWCAGMCFWAFDMLRQSKSIKVFGLVSVIAALAISVSLVLGWATLSVSGMTIILVVICGWQLGIAYSLYFVALSEP